MSPINAHADDSSTARDQTFSLSLTNLGFSHRDGSFEYPQHVLRNKKTNF